MAGMGGYVFGEKDGKPNASDVGLNNSGAVQGAEYLQNGTKKSYSRKVLSVNLVDLLLMGYLMKEKQHLS